MNESHSENKAHITLYQYYWNSIEFFLFVFFSLRLLGTYFSHFAFGPFFLFSKNWYFSHVCNIFFFLLLAHHLNCNFLESCFLFSHFSSVAIFSRLLWKVQRKNKKKKRKKESFKVRLTLNRVYFKKILFSRMLKIFQWFYLLSFLVCFAWTKQEQTK